MPTLTSLIDADGRMKLYVDFNEKEALEYGIKCGGPGGTMGPCPRGGQAANKDVDRPPVNEISAAAKEIRDLSRGKLQEFGVLLDGRGKQIGTITEGGEDTVNDYAGQDLFDVKGSNLSLVHNHPMRENRPLTELSPGDLYTLGKPGMKHMVVTHPYEDGTLTIATKIKDVDDKVWFHAVSSAYSMANNYTHQSKEGKRLAEDNDFAFLDTHRVAIKALEHLGLISLQSTASGKTKAHVDEFSSVYEKWSKATADDVQKDLDSRGLKDMPAAAAIKINVKCGGPGGTMGPCPGPKKPSQSPQQHTKPSSKPAAPSQSAAKPKPADDDAKFAHLPKPPDFMKGKTKYLDWYQSFQNKVDAIYEHGKKGDIAAIEAIKVNPNSSDAYTKKVAKYKDSVLEALKNHKPPEAKPEPVAVVEKKNPLAVDKKHTFKFQMQPIPKYAIVNDISTPEQMKEFASSPVMKKLGIKPEQVGN